MNKAENQLVFPSDDSSEEEISLIKGYLQNAGFSKNDSEWLVDIFKRPDCFGDPTGASVFRNESIRFEGELNIILGSLKERVQIAEDRQTNLAFLFSSMLGCSPGGGLEPNERADSPGWVSEFQKHAKFCAKNLDWKKLSETTQFDKLLPFLFPNGVPLNQVVNLELVNPTRRNSLSSNDFNDPEQLEFWLIWRLKANENRCNLVKLDTLLPDFIGFSEDVLGDKILGLVNSIEYAINMASSTARFNRFTDGWKYVAHELIPFLELLTIRHPESIQERSSLLKAWWHLSKLIYSPSYGNIESKLPIDLKDKLIESASRHIGILRSILRDSPEEFEDSEVNDFYDKAYYVLLSFAPAWKRLKPLLLAFTGMTEQAVAKDLRTWREHDSTDNPPEKYSRVANWIEVAMYPQNLQKELEQDPYLQDLREEFAKFCLGRLRTKVENKDADYTNDDFVEPRPVWRGCYIQALKVLRVNPGGRAHRTLFWLLNNDPDEDVREYAKSVHKQVRHLDRNKPNLDTGTSPRRPLFEAWWWLRQAHLLTLGVEVDRDGAMRTRRTELHRTREKDDRFKRR